MPKLARPRLVAMVAILPCCMLLLSASPMQAQARSSRDVPGLDLRVRPGDVPPDPSDLLAEEPMPDENAGGPFATPEAMAAADRVQRSEIPDRRRGLNALQAGQGSFLSEFLENKTIPLFRVTVEPPF